MQGCLLVDSHKSTGSGPVRSPACPSKKPKKHNQKQKKPSKQKHNHNQYKTNKTPRSGIATSTGNSCMMTSCVSLWEWSLTRSKTNKPQENTSMANRLLGGARWRVPVFCLLLATRRRVIALCMFFRILKLVPVTASDRYHKRAITTETT